MDGQPFTPLYIVGFLALFVESQYFRDGLLRKLWIKPAADCHQIVTTTFLRAVPALGDSLELRRVVPLTCTSSFILKIHFDCTSQYIPEKDRFCCAKEETNALLDKEIADVRLTLGTPTY